MEKAEELNFLAALWPFVGIVFLIAIGVLILNQQFQKKLYRQKLDQEKLKAGHQFELLQTSIAVQEDERKRIARDLHDELGAALSMARMQLVQLEEENAGLSGRIRNVRMMAENALASTRRISHELMPPQLESFGLIQTLESVAGEISNTGKLLVEIENTGSFPGQNRQISLALYRVCMELMNNTIRHAEANNIRIKIDAGPEQIRLLYSDNGKGFANSDYKKGLGLRSIETRIHSVGGKFAFENGASGGLLFTAEIPTVS